MVFNATPTARDQRLTELAGRPYALHRIQAGGADRTVKESRYEPGSGTFTVPARTVAVFAARGA